MLVLYTGSDTKIIMNQGTYKQKKSQNDKTVNYFLAWNVFLMLLPIGLLQAGMSYWFYSTHQKHQYIYYGNDLGGLLSSV